MSKCQAQFLEQAVAVHGDKYDYSEVVYKKRDSKIVVFCKRCNNFFEQLPYHHLRGSGCSTCARSNVSNKLRLSKADFLNKVADVHGDKYDCSKLSDWSRRSKQIINCKVHGPFTIKIGNLLNGVGCPKCGKESSAAKQTKQLQKFIEESRAIHGDKYRYLEYRGALKNAKIICPTHGEYEQIASNHLNGAGCRDCAIAQSRKDAVEFLKQADNIHGQYHGYNLNDYKNHETKIQIECSKHGMFKQRAKSHLNGHGCPSCAIENTRNTTDDFINNASAVHNDRYDYSEVEYVRAHDKVLIKCSTHGVFKQKPNNHLNGQGCPSCVSTTSAAQLEIAGLFDNAVLNDRTVLAPYEMDVYVPSLNLGIEYHGLYWHSYNRKESVEEKFRHSVKCDNAVTAGIRLVQIFEHQWRDRRVLVASMLNHLAGKSKRIGARKTQIIELNGVDYREFCHKNHLYGARPGRVRMGLAAGGVLYCVIGFHRHKCGWEITRYACKAGWTVVGGFSKLLKWFRNKHVGRIVTFADRCYSDADMYQKCGFELVSVSKPNYFYVLGSQVFSRQQFQKHKLQGKLRTFDADLTESENMFANDYRRFWDAGHYKLMLN